MSDATDVQQSNGLEIAVIGMSGRFPCAKGLREFWRNLSEGIESVSFFSEEELNSAGVDPAHLQDPNYVRATIALQDVELFDASFFGYTPREAEIMDPQQRLFLECAYEALESAGYDSETYQGQIGVYAGVSISRYLMNLFSHPALAEAMGEIQLLLANDKDHVSTRVSYKLNLKGPSITVQTACSTSLVAIHQACQSLLSGECDMALAGGASISSHSRSGYFYQEEGILSPDGHCRSYDAKAQGTISGQGVGVVMLKRLDDALADGDHIRAVIKGSAVNNDGSMKVGYTAPSIEGQARVIKTALAVAGVAPETISYVEGHGTGTVMGDPIEVAALAQALGTETAPPGGRALGSVKSNIGHLNAAAGVAGFIKTVLALEHRLLPPSLHFEQPNPNMDLDKGYFYVNQKLQPWESHGMPRRAGISSFGLGGTNAHVILEEAPAPAPPASARADRLLVISARTASALESATANLAEHLSSRPDLNLADVAYTLQVGRKHFKHRRALVCRDIAEAVAGLSERTARTAHDVQGNRPVVFMFPGQGSQHVNMGREVYETDAAFRADVDRCSELLLPHLGLDLRDVLFPDAASADKARELLDQTWITQPALFVIEYALAQLWMRWGVRPQAMLGHSVGELTAATLAGVMTLEEGLTLVAARGRLIQRMPGGSMLAVSLAEQDLHPFLNGELSLAASNGASQFVLSGTHAAIDEVEKRLAERGVESRRLRTSHAFHSEMMEPILDEFAREVAKVRLLPPQVPFLSNVTGTWIQAEEATSPGYWRTHLRRTVRFSDHLSELAQEPDRLLLEVGPGRTLSALARQQMGTTAQVVLASLPRHDESVSGAAFVQHTLGRLWLAGVPVNWTGFNADEFRRRIPLPTYPFERQRYWIEEARNQPDGSSPQQTNSVRQPNIADWFYVPSWQRGSPLALPEPEEFAAEKSNWLIFTDRQGIGSLVAKRLESLGGQVVSVMPGQRFARLTEHNYTVQPQRREHYDSLIRELTADGQTPRRIIHLWNLSGDAAPDARNRFEQAQDLGFHSLLFLAQALGQQNAAEPVRLAVVSSNLFSVTGEESLQPEKATLLGPCKVIPLEYTNITCRNIDLPASAATPQAASFAERIIAETFVPGPETEVAYRGNYRWVKTFEAERIGLSPLHGAGFREGGVYLITGGLGGIGLGLATYLARTFRARLVLLGRTALPPRDEWDRWLSLHGEQDPVSVKIGKLRELEKLGAEVQLIAADVSDETQMRAALAAILERFGVLHGVLHTAGVPGAGMIQLKTPEAASHVFRPKVQGTLTLDRVLEGMALDFMVLFSAGVALTGGFGQVDYCAANSFMDSFAHYRSANRGGLTVSVNWGQWQWDAWQESLAALAPDVRLNLIRMREQNGITFDEGGQALTRVLGRQVPQVIVSPLNFQTILEQHNSSTAAGLLRELEDTWSRDPEHARPLSENTYVPASDEVEQKIAELWQELFGIREVGSNDNFFELGGHSLLAIQLISRIRVIFQVEFPLGKFFEFPTVAGLARAIKELNMEREGGDEIERLLREIEALSQEEARENLMSEIETTNKGDANG